MPTPPIPMPATRSPTAATGLPAGITINVEHGRHQRHARSTSSRQLQHRHHCQRRHADRHRQLHLDGDQHQPAAGLQHRLHRPDRRRGRPSSASTPTPPTPTPTRSPTAPPACPRASPSTPSTGVISGTLTLASAGTYNVVITVSRRQPDRHRQFTWTVTNTNQAPVFSTDFTRPHRRRGRRHQPRCRRHRSRCRHAHLLRHRPARRHHHQRRARASSAARSASTSAGTYNTVITVSPTARSPTPTASPGR